MNSAHFHMVVNHFPIILPIAALLVLLAGILFRSGLVQRIAFGLFALGAATAFIAMNSGEGAEEIAEKIPGITKAIIHEHEEKAEVFGLASYALGILSLLALWFNLKKKSLARLLNYAVIILALITLFLAKGAGTSGGEIRHTEIRTDAATATGVETTGEQQESDDD